MAMDAHTKKKKECQFLGGDECNNLKGVHAATKWVHAPLLLYPFTIIIYLQK